MRNFLFSLFCIFSCQAASAFTVAVPAKSTFLPLGFIAGMTSGHEEITRQSLTLLSKRFSDQGISLDELSPEILTEKEVNFIGTSGVTSQNPIIRGNYATDLPTDVLEHFNLPRWYHAQFTSWTTNPEIQVLHFLRNTKPGDILVSQMETCRSARDNITKSTSDGMRLWHIGNYRSALFLFGHASHTIQDSFSNAHTQRADADHNHDIQKICYYGPFRDTHDPTCYHNYVDVKDDIWIGNPLDIVKRIATLFIPDEDFKENNLKSTAVLARTATLRYLYLLMDYIEKNKDGGGLDEIEVLNMLTEHLFEGRSGDDAIDKGLAVNDLSAKLVMPSGILTCNGLNEQEDHAPVIKNRSAGEAENSQ